MTRDEFWALPNAERSKAWDAIPRHLREAFRSEDGLSPQLKGLEGKRVEVVTDYDETRRFWVGRSSGWVPCHIEVRTRRSLGGTSAERQYKSIRVVNNGPR
jgi:hypothetical protein